jgi:exodeoxyribonuclease-5
MVNDQMREDILSFGIPVVMMGDCNQLPPVFGKSSILDYPDFTLTKIMRQAEGDPIVYLSQCILKGIPIDYGMYGKSRVVSHIPIDRRVVTDYDMIICAKNKTREMLNDRIREDIFHYYDRKPMLGDKVICRQNNWCENINGIYLTNGLVGNITNINYCSLYRDILYIDFQPDFMEDSFEQLSVDYKYLKADFKDKKEFGFTELEKFEYAYAITAHLSQGSEYPNVLFMDEKFHDEETTKRLRYTAVTRARESVTYVKQEEQKKFYQQYNYNGFSYSIPVA